MNRFYGKMICMLTMTGAVFCGGVSKGETLNGAGASFPAPVYSQWVYSYKSESGDAVNYQSVGSGAGIAQIKARTIDFGASDNPLLKNELDRNGLIQFPMLMGGVVPVVNLQGIKPGELNLTGKLLADIYLGKIKKWNDPAIEEINKGLKLPKLPITVVFRSDGSGTTWIFTNYLSKVSEEWAKGPGNDKAVKWPTGVGGQKNPGVAAYVNKVPGAIGYVEFTYATEARLSYTKLQNKSGKLVEPSVENFQEACVNADWKNAPGFYMELNDQPGEKSWPISGVSYILLHREQTDMSKAKALLKYFKWCFAKGGEAARKMNYVPMPEPVVKLIEKELNENLKCSGKAVAE